MVVFLLNTTIFLPNPSINKNIDRRKKFRNMVLFLLNLVLIRI